MNFFIKSFVALIEPIKKEIMTPTKKMETNAEAIKSFKELLKVYQKHRNDRNPLFTYMGWQKMIRETAEQIKSMQWNLDLQILIAKKQNR